MSGWWFKASNRKEGEEVDMMRQMYQASTHNREDQIGPRTFNLAVQMPLICRWRLMSTKMLPEPYRLIRRMVQH